MKVCKECKHRVECLEVEMKKGSCPFVSTVMDYVIGDYLYILRETSDLDNLKMGCRIICETFGIDIEKVDVDGLMD